MPFLPILINLLIGVILSVASTLLQQAFAKPKEQRQTSTRTGTRGSALFGGKVPQYFLVGTVGEAGKREYRNAWGSAGGVPNAYNVDVYSFGDLPITALLRLFVNGVLEPISGSGHVAQGYPSTGDKAGVFWVEFFDGTQMTTSSYLLSEFGADADRPWTSDMIGRGVPYITATALWSQTKWSSFPEIVGEFQGIPLYDPREDDTAGGTGDQRWDDPSTWAFSDNSAVIIYNIERGIYYDGVKVWGGSSTAAQLPYDVWAAAMDACDEAVALDAGGTEPRFRAGRRINFNERPANVIKELLIGCNGRISQTSSGTVYILIGVPDAAEGSFTDADVLASEPLGSIPFPNLDEVINGATATYREPSQAWEDKETTPYLRSDLVEEDDGREQIEGLDLGTTFSGTQAQRIIKAVIEEGRRFGRHVVALPPEFAIYHPLSVLSWTSERFDYAAKMFLITARTISPWGQVVLGLQEIDPADHDWNPATDEHPLSFSPVVTNRPAPQPMTGWGVAPSYIPDNDGVPRKPSIEVSYAAGLVDVRAVRVQVRLAGATLPVFDAEVPYIFDEVMPTALLFGTFLSLTDYEVRGIYLPFSSRLTEWSDWLAVTTPDLPDVEVPPITIQMLAEDLANIVGVLTGTGPGSISDSIDAIIAEQARQAAANLTDQLTFQRVTEGITRKVGAAAAFAIREQAVRITDNEAFASALEQVAAEFENSIASGLLQFQVVASEPGASATIAMKVRASVNDIAAETGLFMRATANGDGTTTADFYINTGKLTVSDGVNFANAFTFDAVTGELKFLGARAGIIKSTDGLMYTDYDNKIIHME